MRDPADVLREQSKIVVLGAPVVKVPVSWPQEPKKK